MQPVTYSLLDMLGRKAPYRLNMVCVRYDSFPLLPFLSSVWPTMDRTNGKYGEATNADDFHISILDALVEVDTTERQVI